jgi:two-component system chemotaxis response regulator CheB
MGGVAALQLLVAGLPAHFPAAVFVVLHTGAHKSEMPALLSRAGHLPAFHAQTGEQICAGQIYIAPPDHHLVLEQGYIRLTKGPRENWARPAIDPLFRSAARAYGSNAIGVILTGALNDGTAGLYEIKEYGGTTIVQDPQDAEYPSMSRSALTHVSIDHCLPLQDISQLLTRLVEEKARAVDVGPGATVLASEQVPDMTADYTLNRPVAVTCPDCGGALRQSTLGTLAQFKCHIGHVYTAEVMMRAQFAALEQSLEMAMRALSERGELCRQMADLVETKGGISAAEWNAAENEAKEQTFQIRQVLEREWLQPDDSHGPNFQAFR